MPTVPGYQRQVQEQAAPNVQYSANATPEAFGGGSVAAQPAQAVQNMASQMHQIGEQEKQQADNTATQDAWTQLVQVKNKLTYDPQSGAFTKKGKDALGVIDDYNPQFDQAADQIQSTLSSQSQRDMFQHMRAKEKEEFNTTLTKHTASEIEQYKDQTTTATVKTASDDAVLNYQDPAKIGQSINMITATIMQQAHDKGWSPEMTKIQLESAVSGTHSQIVNRYLDNGDDRAASAYFAANKDSFSGGDAAHIEKALDEGSTRGESQRASDDIMSRGLSMAAAQAQVREIDNPKLRDATMDRVNQAYSQQEAAKRDGQEKMFLNATNVIEKGGGYNDISPSQIASMPMSMRTALRSYATKQEGPSDIATVYNMKMQAATPELRDAFMKTNILDVKGLNTQDKLSFIDLQAQEKRKEGSLDDKLKGFQSAQQVVDEQLAGAGIDAHPKYMQSAKELVANYHAAVEEKMIQFEKDNSRKPNNKELKDMADQLLIQKTRTGSGIFGFFQDTKPDFEFSTKDISSDARSSIEQSLRQYNIPPTDANVLAAYKRSLKPKAK